MAYWQQHIGQFADAFLQLNVPFRLVLSGRRECREIVSSAPWRSPIISGAMDFNLYTLAFPGVVHHPGGGRRLDGAQRGGGLARARPPRLLLPQRPLARRRRGRRRLPAAQGNVRGARRPLRVMTLRSDDDATAEVITKRMRFHLF